MLLYDRKDPVVLFIYELMRRGSILPSTAQYVADQVKGGEIRAQVQTPIMREALSARRKLKA